MENCVTQASAPHTRAIRLLPIEHDKCVRFLREPFSPENKAKVGKTLFDSVNGPHHLASVLRPGLYLPTFIIFGRRKTKCIVKMAPVTDQ